MKKVKKNNVWNLEFCKKIINWSTEGKCFSGHNQKLHERDFFEFIRVRIENKTLEYEKSEKLTFEIYLGKKIASNFFLTKFRIHATGS